MVLMKSSQLTDFYTLYIYIYTFIHYTNMCKLHKLNIYDPDKSMLH